MAMKGIEILNKIMWVVRIVIQRALSKVKVNGVISEEWKVTTGLRQGDARLDTEAMII